MLKKIFLLAALILLTATPNVHAEESFNMLASTENETEGLGLIKTSSGGEMYFIVGIKDVVSALIPYTKEIYNFYTTANANGEYSPLIFPMILVGQQRGQVDDDLGEWKDNLHLIPVYAQFNVANGQVVCQKPFYSAKGMASDTIEATVQNENYTRLIEIFMTHMPRLHQIVQEKGIALP